MIGDKRSLAALAIPKDEHLDKIKTTLLRYRGRVGLAGSNNERCSMLANVIASSFDRVNQRVTLITDIGSGDDIPFVLDFYLEDTRNHYTVSAPQEKEGDKTRSAVTVRLIDLH